MPLPAVIKLDDEDCEEPHQDIEHAKEKTTCLFVRVIALFHKKVFFIYL